MSGLRDRLVTPSDRYDAELASTRGLIGGVVQAGIHLIGLGALAGLAIVLKAVGPAAWATPPTTTVVLVAASGGGLVGAGMIRVATIDRINRFWRTVIGRLVTVLAIYGAFWGLLTTYFVPGILASLGFVAGRIVAHVSLVLADGA